MKRLNKPKRIIGAKVRLTRDIMSNGGTCMCKGEIATITHSYRGYELTIEKEGERDRRITRVEHYNIEFLTETEIKEIEG